MNEQKIPSQNVRNSAAESNITSQNPARKLWIFDVRRGLPFLIGALTFLFYTFHVSPTVTYGSDCGEFAAVAYRLGIGHPTGFVFYTLIARTFISLSPFGEIAWRLNILSALCGALAVGLICATLARVLLAHRVLDTPDSKRANSQNDTDETRQSEIHDSAIRENAAAWAMCGAGFLLAGFYSFIGQALIMNVHIMIAAMTALILYVAVRWHQSVQNGDADWRWIYAMAVLAGLMLNTHMSWVFAFPGLLTLSVLRHRAVFGSSRELWRRMASLFAFCVASYMLTLYLPLRATLFPTPINGQWWPLDWSHIVDFSSWLNHIRAKQYEFLFLQPTRFEIGGYQFVGKWFASPLSEIPGKLQTLLTFLSAQLLWAIFLVPFGAWISWKRDRTFGISLLLIAIVNLGFEINYDVPVGELANFLFPMYLVMALWIGFALHEILLSASRLGARQGQFARKSSTRNDGESSATNANTPENASAKSVSTSRLSWYLSTILKLLIPATIAAQWMLTIPAASKRGHVSAREAALERADALESLQRKFPRQRVIAVATSSDDTLWSFWYAQFVLGRARGVETPAGLMWRQQLKTRGWTEIVRDWQKNGPVAVTYYFPEVDANFPYVPLSKNGLLWLASHRTLPLPATPLSEIEYSKRNSASAKNTSENAILGVNFPADFTKNGVAHLKRENLANFTLDFRTPFATALPAKNGAPIVDKSSKPSAQQNGFVQILVAPDTAFPTSPPPSQSAVFEESNKASNPLVIYARDPATKISKQDLRLVVPFGTAVGAKMRTILPLQISVETLGKYTVWLRFVRQNDDKTTKWQRAADIVVTGE